MQPLQDMPKALTVWTSVSAMTVIVSQAKIFWKPISLSPPEIISIDVIKIHIPKYIVKSIFKRAFFILAVTSDKQKKAKKIQDTQTHTLLA